jgi:hypothetical protein
VVASYSSTSGLTHQMYKTLLLIKFWERSQKKLSDSK